MKRRPLAFTTVIVATLALAFVVGSGKALACTCDTLLPTFGSGSSDVVSPVNNTTSMAYWDGDCYVLHAPGRPAGEEDTLYWWQILVWKSTDTGWVKTNHELPLNYNATKTTQPYFYEAQLVVFKNQLYAIFSESDGDGLNRGSGHKIVHVSRYDKAADTWVFVDQPAGHDERLGLSYPYYPGPEYWHWAYRNFGGVVATANALYVAWAEGVTWGDGTSSGQLVVAKYDGNSSNIWTYLPTSGLVPQVTYDPNSGLPISNGMSYYSASLGQHQGELVMAYKFYRANSEYADWVLRVDRFDESDQTWKRMSWPLNVQSQSNAAVSLLATQNGNLYIAWREVLKGQQQPYRLYVKKYSPTLGDDRNWSLVGTGPVHTSNPSDVGQGLAFGGDRLLGDAVGDPGSDPPPASPGLTLVAWHNSMVYVDRFNGTSWESLATNGTANVTNPYNYYMSAPSVGAALRYDTNTQTYKYYVAWQAIPSGNTDKHILAARLP